MRLPEHLKSRSLQVFLMAVVSLFPASALATVAAEVLPNEHTPRELVLENNLIRVAARLDWRAAAYSFKFKPRQLELIDPQRPMPLVGIENNWTLNNVGFGLRELTVDRKPDRVEVLIHFSSNYLENPFHVFVRLTLDESAQIQAQIWLENRHQNGYHDIYRERGNATTVVPSIPWLAFLSPRAGCDRRLVYPGPEGSVLESISGKFMDGYKLVEEWERQPKVKPPILQFYRTPAFPTTVEFPEFKVGAFLFCDKTDLNWAFGNKEQALWPSQTLEVAKGAKLTIFEGSLGLFEGDWHQVFFWFKERLRKKFDFSYYRRPGAEKHRREFLAYHSFVYNHMIYDPVENRFQIDRFLEKAQREFGGFDQFWFWHAYPRVGVDPRDQFDLYEDLPGGLKGLKSFVESAHARGTSVFLAYNPWDTTRKRSNMYEAQAKILGAVGADGLLLDTMPQSDKSFREEVDKYNPDAQFVTEGRPPIPSLEVTNASWNHPRKSHPMPRVDLLRFILPEHQIFQIVRWDRDRKPLIQKALFNATGYTVWEDIFGEINLQSSDERALISRYIRIMRDFSAAVVSEKAVPLLNAIPEELFVNGFFTERLNLYTLYQTNHEGVSHFLDNRIIGPLFEVDVPDNWHVVDVWNMRPVEIRKVNDKKVAFLPQEMPEELGVFAAMPQRIRLSQEEGQWDARVPGGTGGTLVLLGVDPSMRNIPGPAVPASSTLSFGRRTVNPTRDGYVVVQYFNENKEVCDVALAKVGY